jgi:hypothetical protein
MLRKLRGIKLGMVPIPTVKHGKGTFLIDPGKQKGLMVPMNLSFFSKVTSSFLPTENNKKSKQNPSLCICSIQLN